jgi:hypothetical protein
MATTVQILTTNYSGQTATITFSPCSGGTINLGSHIVPYNYVSDNYLGDYSLYFADFNQTCTFNIPCITGATPTPTPTVIVATATPTPLPTDTPNPTDTPIPATGTPTPTPQPTSTPTETPVPAPATPTPAPTDTATPTPLPVTDIPTPQPTNEATHTPTPTETPIPYFYYTLRQYDCSNNCNVLGSDLIGRSSVSLQEAVDVGFYYQLLGETNVFVFVNETSPASFDFDLDNVKGNMIGSDDCGTVCATFYPPTPTPNPTDTPTPLPTDTPTPTPTIVSYSYMVDNSGTYYDPYLACLNMTANYTIYSASPAIFSGVTLFSDSNLTNPYILGEGNYTIINDGYNTYVFDTLLSGEINFITNCNDILTPTPTPNPTDTPTPTPTNDCTTGTLISASNCSGAGNLVSFTLNPGYSVDVKFTGYWYSGDGSGEQQSAVL